MRPAAAPLQAAAPLSILAPQASTAEYQGQSSKSTFHIFINSTGRPADLFYFYDDTLVRQGSIEPHSNLYIGVHARGGEGGISGGSRLAAGAEGEGRSCRPASWCTDLPLPPPLSHC